MTPDDDRRWSNWDDLRRRAEDMVSSRKPATENHLSDAKDLVHELTVHQVELELQNQELQKTQQELIRSRNAFQQLYEFAPTGYMSLTPEGVVVEANLAAAELLDTPRRRIIDHPLLPFIHPDHHQLFFINLKRAFDDRLNESFEIVVRPRDTEKRELRITMQSLHSQEAEEVKCLCALEDVSELRASERQLREALQQAELANRAKSDFMANMSHEIRTPINGIVGMLQLMETRPLSKEQGRFVRMAIQSCDRLNRLLGNVLDISCLEAESCDLKLETFNLDDVFRGVEEFFLFSARQMGVKLEFSLEPSLQGRFRGDVVRIEQVLNNLVGNALKYTHEGSVKVEGRLVESDKTACTVTFTVTDTGIGIPGDKIGLLFEPFTQVNQGTTRRYQGAGLGLSICKRLVELMGGELSIESRIGEGTTARFTVKLDLVQPVKVHHPVRDTMESVGKSCGGKVLLVEDDMISSKAVQLLLEQNGHDVSVVEDGTEALSALQKDEFSIVLMDILMPVMSGVAAARAIRDGQAGERNKGIPIVAITALMEAEVKDVFQDAGMDEYILKPVTVDKLSEVMCRYSGEGTAAQATK